MKYQPLHAKRKSDYSLALFVLFLIILIGSKQPIEAADLPDNVTSEVRKIEDERTNVIAQSEQNLKNLHNKYRDALLQLKSTSQSEGNLERIIAIDTLAQEIASGGTIGTVSKDPQIVKIQIGYSKALANQKNLQEQQTAAAENTYKNKIEGVVINLTKAGMISEAVQVRELKSKFANSTNPNACHYQDVKLKYDATFNNKWRQLIGSISKLEVYKQEIVLTIKANLYLSDNRIVVLLNNKYLSETHKGATYYGKTDINGISATSTISLSRFQGSQYTIKKGDNIKVVLSGESPGADVRELMILKEVNVD